MNSNCDSRLNNQQLTDQIVVSMEETFAAQKVSVDSLIITRTSSESNVYTGVLQTSEPNGNFTYSVAITYDGENFTWQTSEVK